MSDLLLREPGGFFKLEDGSGFLDLERTRSDLIADIRAGIAANLATVTDTQIVRYQLANPSTPSIAVFPAQTEYNQAMSRGLDKYTFTVQAIVSVAVDENGQQQLDDFLEPSGSTSIRAAVESDRTLGGAVQNLQVTRVSGYTLFGDSPPVLGAEWTVEVWASGQ